MLPPCPRRDAHVPAERLRSPPRAVRQQAELGVERGQPRMCRVELAWNAEPVPKRVDRAGEGSESKRWLQRAACVRGAECARPLRAPNPVVDVHDRHSGSATIQHCEERAIPHEWRGRSRRSSARRSRHSIASPPRRKQKRSIHPATTDDHPAASRTSRCERIRWMPAPTRRWSLFTPIPSHLR